MPLKKTHKKQKTALQCAVFAIDRLKTFHYKFPIGSRIGLFVISLRLCAFQKY